MIGPAIQGALFISVIYWYTKGMLSLINDYYRDEFKTQLDKDPKKALIIKSTELGADPETCPAVHTEGLPDALESNDKETKPNGIVHRSSDKTSANIMPKQCVTTPLGDAEVDSIHHGKPPVPRRKAPSVPIKSQSSSALGQTDPDSYKNSTYTQAILNPSEIGQSNYRQMANQQASDIADGKTTAARTSSSNRYVGNYFQNDGGTADVAAKQLTGKSTSSIKPSTAASTVPAMVTTMTQKGGGYMFSSTPKIAVNGVLLSTDLIRQRLDEKLQKETCPRKTVNEMVQYWTSYLETVEANEQQTSCQGRKTSTANVKIGMIPRAKSSDEICIRTQSLRLTPDV